MSESSPREDRMWALVFGLLLVTMPAITLVTAYAVLSVTQSAILEQIGPLELVELYLVELVAFGLFSYVLYRLARYAWAKHDASTDTSVERAAPTTSKETQTVDSVEKDRN